MEEFEGSLQREVVSILRQALLLVEKCLQNMQSLFRCWTSALQDHSLE
jgi:hypothetical protein